MCHNHTWVQSSSGCASTIAHHFSHRMAIRHNNTVTCMIVMTMGTCQAIARSARSTALAYKLWQEREELGVWAVGWAVGTDNDCMCASRHAEDGLEYMFRLRNPDVFRFCAIPRVMAIATLAEIYNNHRVPTGPLLSAPFLQNHSPLYTPHT